MIKFLVGLIVGAFVGHKGTIYAIFHDLWR